MEEVKETTAQQVSELLQIRRDKLTELQEAGRDPFRETRFERDATSAGIKDAFEDYENKHKFREIGKNAWTIHATKEQSKT